MPPEKKKTLIDYAKILGIYTLIVSVWGAGFYVGGEVKAIGIRFTTYDGYGLRIKTLEYRMDTTFKYQQVKDNSQDADIATVRKELAENN